MTIEEKLAERIAREPKGEPFAKEIATTKLLIAEAHAIGDSRVVLINLKQLVALSRSRFDENRAAHRTIERHELQGCEQVFCLCLQCVFWGYPDSAVLPPLVAHGPFDYDGEGIAIMLDSIFKSDERAQLDSERNFYVAADAPDRAEFERLLLAEPQSRFMEEIALVHLMYEHWFKVGDRILLEGCSKALSMLSKAGRALQEFERDFWLPSDLMLKQQRLVEWAEQIPPQSDAPPATAPLWRADVLRLCGNFAECVRFIVSEKLDASARDMLLDKFIMAGAGTCYPMLYAEG